MGNQSKNSKSRHWNEFWVNWDDVRNKIKNDTDAIKELMENGIITKDVTNSSGWGLLHWAARGGNYEIAKLCINSGYDLGAKTEGKFTPLKVAEMNNKYNVAQLLRLSAIKGNIGERIKDKAKILNRERGCIENIQNGLKRIGKQTAKIWKDTTIEMVTNCIQNKQCFDDIFLSLCYEFIGSADFEKSVKDVILCICIHLAYISMNFDSISKIL